MHTFRLHPTTKYAEYLTHGEVIIYTSSIADPREARFDMMDATIKRLRAPWDRLGYVPDNFRVVGIPNISDQDGLLKWTEDHAECAYCGEKQDRTNDQCWLLTHSETCAVIAYDSVLDLLDVS